MSVTDGQDASAAILNSAYVSKTADSSVTSKINLNSTDAASGDDITDAQLAINQLTFKTYANEAISAAGEISSTTLKGLQARRVSGSGAARTAATTPFGSTGGWVDGTVIRLIGTHDTNTLSITSTDSAKGAVLNGSTITLKKDDTLDLQYDESRDRWIEVSRNTTNTILGGNLDVAGNITATGSITANGDITLGDADTDTIDVVGDLTIKSGNGIFIEDDSGDKITVTAPSAIDAPYTLTLPANDGNNGQALISDGSGTLSFGNAGGGGTGKNYITNSDCASSVITPWAAYADAAATIAADGTGGSATVTITANTSSPLSDDADFVITKDAANRQGEGVGCAFTIDNADKAKKMIISFDYTTSADYADDDIKVFVYDVTNTNLIRVNGENLKANSGVGKHYAQFQTASNSTSYRLILHCSSTNASAYTVNFDTAHVGPQEISHGTIITDWVDFTSEVSVQCYGTSSHPTLSSSPSLNQAYWRRVGSNMEIKWNYKHGSTTGTSQAGTIELMLIPSGYAIDSTAASFSTNSLLQSCGYGLIKSSGSANGTSSITTKVIVDTYTTTSFSLTGDSTYGLINSDSELNFADDDVRITLNISVPIEGWSANAKMSEDLGTNLVAARYTLTDDTFVIDSAGVDLKYADIDYDTHNAYDTSTGEYTVPVTGYYSYNVKIHGDSATHAANDYLDITVQKDTGSGYANIDRIVSKVMSGIDNADNTFTGSIDAHLSGMGNFTKGTKIKFVSKSQETDTVLGGAGTYILNNFSIARLSDSQTILENETVAAKYYNTTATQSFDYSSGHSTKILNGIFADSSFDTHNAMSMSGTTHSIGSDPSWYYNQTGDIYTIPVTGIYQVNASIQIDGLDPEAFAELYLRNVTNETYESQAQATTVQTDSTTYHDNVYLNLSTLVQASKGDQLVLGLHVTSSDSTVNIPANLQSAEFSIAKIK